MRYIVKLKIDLCDPLTCSLEIGYSNPPTCLAAVCNAGYYPIFESCEGKYNLGIYPLNLFSSSLSERLYNMH